MYLAAGQGVIEIITKCSKKTIDSSEARDTIVATDAEGAGELIETVQELIDNILQ